MIAYDGTDYHGWQIQPDLRTVQGTLCAAASTVLRQEIRVQGASRTDAGVHAQGQWGLIPTIHPITADHLVGCLNDTLPPSIVVREAVEVSNDYVLLDHVSSKAYRYTLCTSRVRPWRMARFCWHYPGHLHIEDMQQAAEKLLGRHDFSSFAAGLEPGQNTIRTLTRCQVFSERLGEDDFLHFDVEGDGFLFHMVRIIVGTLVDIGRGHWPAHRMSDILYACHRQAAGHLAPAAGLCLMEIHGCR